MGYKYNETEQLGMDCQTASIIQLNFQEQ